MQNFKFIRWLQIFILRLHKEQCFITFCFRFFHSLCASLPFRFVLSLFCLCSVTFSLRFFRYHCVIVVYSGSECNRSSLIDFTTCTIKCVCFVDYILFKSTANFDCAKSIFAKKYEEEGAGPGRKIFVQKIFANEGYFTKYTIREM